MKKNLSFGDFFTNKKLFVKLKAGILLAVTNQWCGVNGVLFYSNSMYDNE